MRLALCARAVMALALFAVSARVCPAVDQSTVEMARARAEASVAIAKATVALPCQDIECKRAESKADELIVLARLFKKSAPCQCSNGACANCDCPEGVCATLTKAVAAKPASPPAKKSATGYTISADRRTMTYDDGRVFVLYTDGTYRAPPPQAATAIPASTGCVTINGRTVCPFTR